MRINKYLVNAGLANSRRKADEIIIEGRVTINESTLKDLSYKVKDNDEVRVDGISGELKKHIYIAYNKPKGEICSHKRYGDDKTIFDSLPKAFSKLKIAGRLDKDSEGIVILSSDGEFINNISHPSKNKSKAYLVTTKEEIADNDIDKLNEGVKLEDGVSRMKVGRQSNNTIKITMSEGKNRQIRRSLEAIQKTVIKLIRIRVGNFSSHKLLPENFVFIKPEDVI